MDLKNKKFRIIERINSFHIEVEVPSYRKPWFGRAYYDESRKIWALVSIDGQLISKNQPRPSAQFPSMSKARDFVRSIQKPKGVTIIGEDGEDVKTLGGRIIDIQSIKEEIKKEG